MPGVSTSPLVDAKALARTYQPRSYPDPAEQLDDYQRVREYVSKHPDHGRNRVGSALDLPPGRVRSWLDGAKPDAVRAVETARDHAWLDAAPNSSVGDALAVIAAATYACGSIDGHGFIPAWNPETAVVESLVIHVLDVLGVGHTTRHADDPERPTEIVAARDAPVLGRALRALGVPQEFTYVSSLPDWLYDCSTGTRRTCGLVWVCERATSHQGKGTLVIQGQSRGEFYRRTVAALLREIADGPVNATEQNVVISAEAARTLPAVCR